MHAILSITALHRHYLVPAEGDKYKYLATNHMQLGLEAFNARLRRPITCEDSDAMLMTSGQMSGALVSMVPTSHPHEAWPMTDHTDDLQWLSVQRGTMIILLEVRICADHHASYN